MAVSIIICVLLHKLGGIRQCENKFSLRSLAPTLHKLGGIRRCKKTDFAPNDVPNDKRTKTLPTDKRRVIERLTHYYI